MHIVSIFFADVSTFSALFHETSQNYSLHCKIYKKRINNRRKLVDLPNERYYIALYRKWGLVSYTLNIFCWHQHFFSDFSWNIAKLHHVTSRDVIMSDFYKHFRRCFSYWYCVMVKIWSHLHKLKESYEHFRVFRFNMGNIGKIQEIPTYPRQTPP